MAPDHGSTRRHSMSRHLPDKRRSVSTEEIEPRPRHFTQASLTVHKRVNISGAIQSCPIAEQRALTGREPTDDARGTSLGFGDIGPHRSRGRERHHHVVFRMGQIEVRLSHSMILGAACPRGNDPPRAADGSAPSLRVSSLPKRAQAARLRRAPGRPSARSKAVPLSHRYQIEERSPEQQVGPVDPANDAIHQSKLESQALAERFRISHDRT